ncbi:LacI family DNA-binding transcriptional regulator [Devosia sp. YIM 151766]|uniref:LacI family DNA-binding transcriptional regulator n=1 Tax=Devosia sp. YIM 151766 TaxID=3017325 RepID=UPI00255CF693|nr:LacI family DNA-binding transcriptional regulator [Devosia sp. YIM 151766]WIY53209.1 LacI family DNA-binding transcriptional regulator [Devosia sp. YIM 151766]
MSRRKTPTIKDVARAAGVSSATVSYVLNNLNKVTPEVDALVRKAAAEIGYSRNNAARALKTGRNQVIGCILPNLSSPVFPEIANAVQMRAEALGYATLVIDSGNEPLREERVVQTLVRHGVDGAVAMLHPSFKPTSPPIFPMVSLDAQFAGLDSIQADHFAGGRLMAEHIIALGHRRIGMLSGFSDLSSNRERREGFMSVAAGRIEVVWEVNVHLLPQLRPEALDAIRRREVTMIACVNDLVAIAALSALKAENLSVPGDVSVIGFDDMQWSSWPLIDLSTVRQPLDLLGEQAVELLVDRLRFPTKPIENRVLPVSFIQRGSTAPMAPSA